MKTETIVRAIENGKLNDAREGIDDIMINKIADSLEEKKQSLGDTLVGVCEDCDEIEEGNEFSKALRTARKEGKSTFTVDGKEYTVEDYEDDDEELSEEDTKYQKFFRKALEKFNVSSPADFKSEEEKKKFFDYVDKNYKADKEED